MGFFDLFVCLVHRVLENRMTMFKSINKKAMFCGAFTLFAFAATPATAELVTYYVVAEGYNFKATPAPGTFTHLANFEGTITLDQTGYFGTWTQADVVTVDIDWIDKRSAPDTIAYTFTAADLSTLSITVNSSAKSIRESYTGRTSFLISSMSFSLSGGGFALDIVSANNQITGTGATGGSGWTGSNNIVDQIAGGVAAVPEPSTSLPLAFLVLAAFGLRRRRASRLG